MPRRVVITGGSSGIGFAIARRFAQAGDIVTITGRNERKLVQAAESLRAQAIRCDAADPSDVEGLAEVIDNSVDVLVNVAGANTDEAAIPGATPSLHEVADSWRTNLDTNLISAVLTTTALLPRIPTGGAIITTGSMSAEFAAASYAAAKAALASWTSGLSAQVGPRGITANTIVPSYIADTDFYATPLPEQYLTSMVAATHTKRLGTPEDVAGVAFFLAGPDARHITGQAMHINGGAHTTR